MKRWWRDGLSGKLAVVFIVYIVVGVPSLLYVEAAIFGNTPASASLAVALSLVLTLLPVFVIPVVILVLELRKRLGKPSWESGPTRGGRIGLFIAGLVLTGGALATLVDVIYVANSGGPPAVIGIAGPVVILGFGLILIRLGLTKEPEKQ